MVARPSVTATRSHLDGSQILQSVQEILQWLLLGYRPVYAQPAPTATAKEVTRLLQSTPVHWVALEDADLKRFNAVLTTQLKLLAKVLPDLRSIELNDISERKHLTDIELAQRVHSVLSASSSVIEHPSDPNPSKALN